MKHVLILFLGMACLQLTAQPPLSDVIVVSSKPEQFETKIFKSEKTGQKKFNLPRRFIQNTGSHFNYYFNAREKLNTIFQNAKDGFKDNYDELLPFYGYDLNAIAQNTTEIDSIIYKATAGIIFHDLRTNWIDNFYLLIGKAYMLRKDYDSAALTFQFINYQFAQGKDGASVTIGSNNNSITNSTISVATKENRNLINKAFTLPPSRNDALIWQVRNYLEANDLASATGLLQVLDNDPIYPKRLKPNVNEQFAYLFYKLGNYDSASARLKLAMPAAQTKLDKSRWYYLLGQMNSGAKKYNDAADAYQKAIKLTNDPLMSVYARIEMIRNDAKNDPTQVNDKINALLKLTKKDDYKPYRDVIYFTLGEIELDRKRTPEAIAYFEKCTKYATPQSKLKNKAFNALLNFAIGQKQYINAANYADSLMAYKVDTATNKALAEKVIYLPKLREQLLQVEINDSLIAVANLTEAQRTLKIKEVAKALRKEKGLKEEAAFVGTAPVVTNLFEVGSAAFYFDNASLRTRGYNEFKLKWGNRSNLDNWRRKAAINNTAAKNPYESSVAGTDKDDKATKGTPALTAIKLKEKLNESAATDDLLKNIPATQAQIDSVQNIVLKAHIEAANLLLTHPEDFETAIAHLQIVIDNAKDQKLINQAKELLYYAYKKTGNLAKANEILKSIKANNPNSIIAKMGSNATNQIDQPTATYKTIYNLYLAGNFEEALAKKKQADLQFGENFWTPQLLYIEAVYFVKTNKDSLAKANLTTIISAGKEPNLVNKATVLLNVLNRRAEIEGYLNTLEVKPIAATKPIVAVNTAPANTIKPVIATPKPTVVDAAKTTPVTKPPTTNTTKPAVNATQFVFDTLQPYTLIVVYNNLDALFLNEANRAFEKYNKDYHAAKNLTVNSTSFGANSNASIIASFNNGSIAYEYLKEVKKYAKSEILTWLTTDKYYFTLISNTNLLKLNASQNLAEYEGFIKKMMPGKL